MATTGGNRRQGELRREQIIVAALELFGEVGFRAAGLRDIAARAGMSHPGLLYHFRSKEELLAAVLKYRDEAQDALWNPGFPDGPGPQDVLTGIFAMAQDNSTNRRSVELFATLAAESTDPQHPAHRYFVERYEEVRARFTGHAEVLADAGLLPPGLDPKVAAVVWIAILDGLQVQWLYSPESIDMVGLLQAFLAATMRTGEAPPEA